MYCLPLPDLLLRFIHGDVQSYISFIFIYFLHLLSNFSINFKSISVFPSLLYIWSVLLQAFLYMSPDT